MEFLANVEVAEMIAVATAIVGGLWAVGKALLKERDALEHRIDQLERESVTREEFHKFVDDIRAENAELRRHIDNKLDVMNGNIMLVLTAMKDN